MADSGNTDSKKDTNVVEEDVEISFVAAIFDDVDAAKQAYTTLKSLNREGFLTIIAAAYMEKTERNKLKVHEFKDWQGKQGAVAGGAAGAVVGLVGGAILLPVAVGALVGGVWAKTHDTKLSQDDLRKAAASLRPGTSALVAITKDDFVDSVVDELGTLGGKKVHSGEVPASTFEALSIVVTTQK